jgi:hypothetical protein
LAYSNRFTITNMLNGLPTKMQSTTEHDNGIL